MSIYSFVDFFIHESRFYKPSELRKARIFVRTCLLTSLFSMAYIVLSSNFEFREGVYLMTFNVILCLALPVCTRTRIPISWLGNVFLFVSGSTVFIITYLTGGLWSSVYLWIIAIPVVALLIVNKLSSIVWGVISLGVMIGFGLIDIRNNEHQIYDKGAVIVYVAVVSGLLLIILLISLVFEFAMTKALKEVESKNELLAQQNETINDQAAQLEELIEEKDYIIQILAHDLRSPLASITGMVDIMRKEQTPEERENFLELINRATNNANNLVNRVLEMDVSDQKDVKAELLPLHIVETIEAVIQDSQEIANKKSIQLQVRDNSTNKIVLADKTCLTQVFQNLVSNAIKFSPTNTLVQAVLSDSEGSVQIRIIDEGQGIKPTEENKLFKKFSKLSTRPTAGESSSGLGLSLVKRYAELTGGKVWFERNSGVGSTFVVEIPLAIIK